MYVRLRNPQNLYQSDRLMVLDDNTGEDVDYQPTISVVNVLAI